MKNWSKPSLLLLAMHLGTTPANAAPDSTLSGDTGIYAADPSVIRTEHGYVAVESRRGHTFVVRVAPTLEELVEAKAVRIWFDRDGLSEVWAPEIVHRNGGYTVYFAAGVGSAHRMYAISSEKPAANFGAAAEIALPENKWAIDGLPFTYRDTRYFVWSGWEGDTDVRQDLFLVRLDANDQPTGPRVRISAPTQPWENIAGETPVINEGPQPILDPAGQLHIVYSANGSWGANYCLADLRLRADADPLDPTAWLKSDGCLFSADEQTLTPDASPAIAAKGVGHHSFILANGNAEEADTSDGPHSFLYHGVPAADEPSNFWAARKWFLGTYRWVPEVSYGSGTTEETGWSLSFSE